MGRSELNLKERARQLKAVLPAVALTMKDRRTPAAAKIVAAAAVIYALSPIDLIPDFIPVVGYLDDLIIIPVLVALTVRLVPKNVWQENLRKADKVGFSGGGKWYFALPVLILWGLCLYALFLMLKPGLRR